MNHESKDAAQLRAYRNALGQFPTGVAIVTAIADNLLPVGVTINSFNSISMSPALVSWSIDHAAASYDVFRNATSYTVTVLAQHQTDLAIRFATRGEDKFRDVEVEGNEAPVIPGGCAWFKCDICRAILLGDHTMLVGRVTEFATNSASPLIFRNGQFLPPAITTQKAA